MKQPDKINLIGVTTGRFSSKGPNLANVPRTDDELDETCTECGRRRGAHSILEHCPGHFPPGTEKIRG